MKNSVRKRILSLALALMLCLSVGIPVSTLSPVTTASAVPAISENQQHIVDRANYLYNLTWVAQKTVSAHSYSSYYTFYAGNTYHLPYGQGPTANYIGYGVSPENFVVAAADINSVFYRYKSTAGSWYSTYYITDCSGFVSWCWGLTAKQSTRSLANYSSYVASVTTNNIRNYLRVGDALNRYDYHVVLVTDMIYDNSGNLTGIEITEQTIPQTKRTIYTPAQLASAYASYDGIYRYHGTVPEAPYTETVREETWIEKAAFDTMVYRDRNPDIADLSDADLKKHWLEHGIKEGRASSPVLDLGFYRNNNPDLKEAFGDDYEALYNHFITSGYKEYRKSSALFDGSFYCKNYPDVAANYKENYMLHYVDHGIKEGRRASLTFDVHYYLYIRPDVGEAWPDDYEMAAKHYAGHGINAQIQAYDHQHPVVSDVTISNVTAEGYTVSCTVTDDWGVQSVAFPTWTLLNDQDDLPADFMNTQLGSQSGNTFTFLVKASDHNYELGQYVTHIYATDKGGNRVQITLDPVELKNQLDHITLSSTTSYCITDARLENVKQSTMVDELLAEFENNNLQILNRYGEEISGSDVVGTGSQINLYANDELIDSVTVVVVGDVDGNGGVDSTDYMQIKSTFLGELSLDTFESAAADVDGNGVVDITDYLRVKAHFLGYFDI